MKAELYFWKDFRDWCHHKGLEGCRGGDSHYISSQLPYLVCAEDRWILENDSKLKQVVTPTEALLYQRWFPCLSKLT